MYLSHFHNISGRQRESLYSNCGDEESMSGFGKAIAKKRNALKSPRQEELLKNIDTGLSDRAIHATRNETVEVKRKEERHAHVKAHKRDSVHDKHERKEEKRRAVCGCFGGIKKNSSFLLFRAIYCCILSHLLRCFF